MQKEVSVSESCKDGGVLPNSGFPRDGGMANEERAKTSLRHGANIRFISCNTCIRSRVIIISGLYLRSVHFGVVRVRYNVEEVVVLAAVVVEVVVLVS